MGRLRVRRSPLAALDASINLGAPYAGEILTLSTVGAGVTLTGPGGDGHLSVVTPASPIGRAVLGRHSGDTVDVTVEGQPREWTICYVG